MRHIDAVALGTMGHLQNKWDYGARRSMKMNPVVVCMYYLVRRRFPETKVYVIIFAYTLECSRCII